jgi:hypothetical protein
MGNPHKANGTLAPLQDEHVELNKALALVNAALSAPDRRKAVVVDLIDRLVEDVEIHFRHEEEGGYFRAVVARAPRLSEQADELQRQHAVLAEQGEKLRLLARSGMETESWWKLVEQQLADFRAQFADHERRENSLLQEAYDLDIGPAD